MHSTAFDEQMDTSHSSAMEYIFAVVVGLLLLVFLFIKKGHKPLAFPGPVAWPLFGSFMEMRGQDFHKILAKWALRYGSAFKFSLFGQDYLVVSQPDTLTEVLITRGKAFSGRMVNIRLREMTGGCQNLVSGPNLGLNAALRKAVHPCIQIYGTERAKVAMTLTSSVKLLLDNFRTTSGKAFNPTDSIHKATALTIFLLLCGEELGDVDGLSEAVRKQDQLANVAFTSDLGNMLFDGAPWLKHLPWFPPYQNVLKFKAHRDRLYESIVLPALNKSNDTQCRTVGKALLKAIGQRFSEGEESGEITMEHVKLVMIDFLVAGTITTTGTFSALILILQHHPEIQEKAYKEIMEEIGSEKMIDFDDKGKLHYCQAIVLEVLRYFPVVPLSIFHVTKEDTSLGGVEVPRGTNVIPNFWGCHHDPELWTDPWDFRPERFLDDDGTLVPADHVTRKQSFPFGAGTRVCVGQVLALNRLFVFLANCLQKFKFVPPDDADPRLCDVRNFPFSVIMQPPPFVTRAVPRM